jgi:hypothetical protein
MKMTKAQKEAQKRWRESHREQYNKYQINIIKKIRKGFRVQEEEIHV